MILPSIRRIFASFRTEEEEKKYSRKAFFNLLGFIGSCVLFSFAAQKLTNSPRDMMRTANSLVQAHHQVLRS